MKLNKKYCVKKIKYIDSLLDNKDELDKYINNIENSKLDIPLNIEENIKLKLDTEKVKNDKKNNYKYLNILKVACFCLVVMITWAGMTNIQLTDKEYGDVKNNEVNNIERVNKISAIYGKVSNFTNVFSNLLLSPIEFERGVK